MAAGMRMLKLLLCLLFLVNYSVHLSSAASGEFTLSSPIALYSSQTLYLTNFHVGISNGIDIIFNKKFIQ